MSHGFDRTPQGAEPSAEQASALLHRSRSASRAARAEGRWVVTYLLVFGLTALVLIPFFGYVYVWPVFAIISAVWLVVLFVLTIWASRRPVTPRGAANRMGAAFLLFGVLLGVTCLLGFTALAGQWWWWVLGGIASSAPMLVAALREARR